VEEGVGVFAPLGDDPGKAALAPLELNKAIANKYSRNSAEVTPTTRPRMCCRLLLIVISLLRADDKKICLRLMSKAANLLQEKLSPLRDCSITQERRQ
jgi:hypothetical protein